MIHRILKNLSLILLAITVLMILIMNINTKKRFEEEVPQVIELNKYVSFSCGNGGRLGNQFWPLFSIWSVGQTLGRQLYINCNNKTMEMINYIRWIFPKTGGMYEIMKPKNEKAVPFAFADRIHGYENPKNLLNRTEKYLRLQNYYAMNALFIVPYRKQIDELLEFGGEITDMGEKIVAERKISVDNVICAHIRQSDFKGRKWDKSYEDCLASVRHVARKQQNQTLVVMGDDQKFMSRMVTEMIKSGEVNKDSFYSNYSRAEDLYLSKRLCRTFVLTSEGSSFGFWLAWLAGEHSDIYYLNENRTSNNIPKFDDQFPLPWIPINVINGTVV